MLAGAFAKVEAREGTGLALANQMNGVFLAEPGPHVKAEETNVRRIAVSP
jgi:hypothetical protein